MSRQAVIGRIPPTLQVISGSASRRVTPMIIDPHAFIRTETCKRTTQRTRSSTKSIERQEEHARNRALYRIRKKKKKKRTAWVGLRSSSRHMFDSILFPTRIDKRLRLDREVLHPLCARRLPRRRRIPRDILWHLEHDRNRHDLELSVVCLGTRKREGFLGF
jgi:hypothetical protein